MAKIIREKPQSNVIEKKEDDHPSFAQSRLPLFNGPRVKLRLVPSEKEYEVSAAILSEHSSYFAKMFQKDRFIEGKEREATLEEMDGVVSAQSLEHLLEWMYMGSLSFTSELPSGLLSEALEFIRMADMCDVHGVDQPLVGFVRHLIAKSDPDSYDDPELIILPQHIKSASFLPRGHPVRPVIIKQLAKTFIDVDDFPYFDEISRYPSISTDILKEVRPMYRNRRRR